MKRVRQLWLFLVLLLFILAVFWWKNGFIADHYPIVEIDSRSYVVSVADEPLEWQRGLSGQKNKYMTLFVFPDKQQRSFWMKDMLYAIDIVWLADDRVVGVTHNLPLPGESGDQDLPRFWSPQPVDMVLEIPVDFRQESGINIEQGETIKINI